MATCTPGMLHAEDDEKAIQTVVSITLIIVVIYAMPWIQV
jgi:hypothetical protein